MTVNPSSFQDSVGVSFKNSGLCWWILQAFRTVLVNPSSFQDSVGESFKISGLCWWILQFSYSGTLYRILSLGIQICTRDFFKGSASILVVPSKLSKILLRIPSRYPGLWCSRISWRALSLIISDKFANFEARDLSLVGWLADCTHVIQLGVARHWLQKLRILLCLCSLHSGTFS